jgi:hypothetical protein
MTAIERQIVPQKVGGETAIKTGLRSPIMFIISGLEFDADNVCEQSDLGWHAHLSLGRKNRLVSIY